MGVVAIRGKLRRQSFRLEITDVGLQIGARIGALDVENLAVRRPVERERLLRRRVIVIGSRQRVLIVQQREIGRDAELLQWLIVHLHSHLLIVIKTSPEVNASTRSAFELAGNRDLLAGPEGGRAQSNILPQLLLSRTR